MYFHGATLYKVRTCTKYAAITEWCTVIMELHGEYYKYIVHMYYVPRTSTMYMCTYKYEVHIVHTSYK